MDESRKKIAVYSRKSRFTGKGESIGNQVELCRAYLAAHMGQEAAAAAVVYEDEGFSGGTLDRPAFRNMMRSARNRELSAIVVYRLDRISRNISDFSGLVEELGRLGIDFISIREQFDTGSPMGRAMMYIASVFSQLERETIAERIRDNLHELAKTGRWLGGTTPTGYASEQVQSVTVDGKTRKACRLKVIPEEAEVVRTIFRQFLTTHSLTQTDAFLLQNGYLTKKGKYFTRFAIKGILSNPVYLAADAEAYRYLSDNQVELFSDASAFDGRHGVMAYHRTLQKPGRAHENCPMTEWIVCVGKHPGLIPGAQWVRAQQLLEQNRSKSYRKPRSSAALLSGLLICGSCGSFLRPKRTQRKDAEGRTIYTYLCSLKERSRGQCCRIGNVDGGALDRALLEALGHLPEDTETLLERLETAERAVRGIRTEDRGPMDRSAAVAANDRQIRALTESLAKASGTPAERYILQKIDDLHARRELLARGADAATKTIPALSDAEKTAAVRSLDSFSKALSTASVEQKRTAVRACVRRAVWDGREVCVEWFGSGEDGRSAHAPEGDR